MTYEADIYIYNFVPKLMKTTYCGLLTCLTRTSVVGPGSGTGKLSTTYPFCNQDRPASSIIRGSVFVITLQNMLY